MNGRTCHQSLEWPPIKLQGTDGSSEMGRGTTTNEGRSRAVALALVVVVVGGAVGAGLIWWSLRGSEPWPPVTTDRSHTSVTSGSEESSRESATGSTDHGGTGEAVLNDKTIQAGLIQREYLVVTPSWMTSGDRLPVVLALHGLSVDRFAMLDTANWREAVESRGFVAVFPQGFGNSWNVGPCCPPANLLQMDDVGFLDSVIAAVTDTEGVDPDRVYMTGFSGGALMTYHYACQRSERLKAIGPIAGVNLNRCVPSQPLSLLHQHSDPDPVVPFDGSIGAGQLVSSEQLPPVVETVQQWASAEECDGPSNWTQLAESVDTMKWGSCTDGIAIEIVRLKGVGHEWPKTRGYDGLAGMLDFFGIK